MKRIAIALAKLTWGKRAYAVFALYAATAIAVRAQSATTFTTLYSFCMQGGSACTDGALPYGGLIQATNGEFYGTTYSGGTGGYGTLFQMTPSGTLTTQYSFCSQSNCADGANPYAGVVQATDGNLYGTTYTGGNSNSGTVFKSSLGGSLTTLFDFCAGLFCAGGKPYAALIQATDGYLYGTFETGYDYGGVFKISTAGAESLLAVFICCLAGTNPYGALVQGSDGNFYGTTSFEGSSGGFGGTVFEMTPTGTLMALYGFCRQANCTDGEQPLRRTDPGRRWKLLRHHL